MTQEQIASVLFCLQENLAKEAGAAARNGKLESAETLAGLRMAIHQTWYDVTHNQMVCDAFGTDVPKDEE